MIPDLKDRLADVAATLSWKMHQMRPFKLYAILSAVFALPIALYTGHFSVGVQQFFFMLVLWPFVVIGFKVWGRIRRRYLL